MIYQGYRLLYLYNRSNSSGQPIWSTNMSSTFSDTCFGTKNSCPSSSVSKCSYYATVECSK